MPVVNLRYKPEHLSAFVAHKLAEQLTYCISEALDVPENKEARLTPKDIEVTLVELGSNDVNVKSLEIMVWAHNYPERLETLESRKSSITTDVRRFLAAHSYAGLDGWVWVLLTPSAFGKIS